MFTQSTRSVFFCARVGLEKEPEKIITVILLIQQSLMGVTIPVLTKKFSFRFLIIQTLDKLRIMKIN